MFLLVLVFLTGTNSRPFPAFQEFETMTRCEEVKNSMTAAWKRNREPDSLLVAYCTKK